MWDVWNRHPSKPEVVVPYGRHRIIPGVTVHRSRALDPTMVTTLNHIRVTKPLIMVLDIGVVVSAVEVGDVIILGRQKKLFSVDDVRTTIDLHARPGRTGIAVARQAVALIMIGERPADSVLEFRFHIGPAQHGLPPYSYQHKVSIGRKTYFIDFAYPKVMLAIEVDGYEKRASKDSLAYDNDRQNQLSLAGWNFLRFGWDRVVDTPALVAAQVLMRLGQLGYQFHR
jgi:very-short-patch-repair endonuclease